MSRSFILSSLFVLATNLILNVSAAAVPFLSTVPFDVEILNLAGDVIMSENDLPHDTSVEALRAVLRRNGLTLAAGEQYDFVHSHAGTESVLQNDDDQIVVATNANIRHNPQLIAVVGAAPAPAPVVAPVVARRGRGPRAGEVVSCCCEVGCWALSSGCAEGTVNLLAAGCTIS